MKTTNRVKRISAVALVLAIVLSFSVAASAASSVSMDRAKELAYADAGISADSVTAIDKLVQYRSGNDSFYKYIFRTATTKYVYVINAATGELTHGNAYTVKASKHGGNGGCATESAAVITPEEALSIAMAHAGVSADALKKQKVELDRDDGVLCYEVELKTAGGWEYDYEIDATTGAVLDYEIDD